MEKITKEELLEELKLNGVSDEDLAKIAGGEEPDEISKCMDICMNRINYPYAKCLLLCKNY